MRPGSLLMFAAFFAALPASAALPVDAVIVSDVETFTMTSGEEGTLSVKRTVRVLNSNGVHAGTFLELTDADQTITEFSGQVETAQGKKDNIRKKHLVTVSLASGLAEDGFLNYFSPENYTPPFTVTYEYKLRRKNGIPSFPSFIPVTTPRTSLLYGSYRISVPEGTAVRSATHGPCIQEDSHGFSWTVKDFEGYVEEHDMPPVSALVPSVYAAPETFSYGGVPGSQGSWNDLGKWYLSLLSGNDALPEATVAKVGEMTAGTEDEVEKIRILYNYLREHTRYVSIQFGIGGYKPFPAAQVDATGFGDCKALSNYMGALLKAAGIDSRYAVLNTDESDFMDGFASLGRSNHAMLAVPLKSRCDTIWLECTNPVLPLGYRHTNVAGHQALLVGPEGGQPVRAASYPDSLSRIVSSVRIDLQPDGSASLDVERSYASDRAEPWVGFDGMDPSKRVSKLASGLDGQPQNLSVISSGDNFDSYDGPSWYPVFDVAFRFDMRVLGRINRERMVLPLNPFSKRLTSQRSERIYPYVSGSSSTYIDSLTISIPEGYSVESIPQDVIVDEVWGIFESTVRIVGDTSAGEALKAVVVQRVKLKECIQPAERYGEYRNFVRRLNKAYTAGMVLKKDQP